MTLTPSSSSASGSTTTCSSPLPWLLLALPGWDPGGEDNPGAGESVAVLVWDAWDVDSARCMARDHDSAMLPGGLAPAATCRRLDVSMLLNNIPLT